MEGGRSPRKYTPALQPHHHDHQHADNFINNDEPPKIHSRATSRTSPQAVDNYQYSGERETLSTPIHVVMLNRSSSISNQSHWGINSSCRSFCFSLDFPQKTNITAIDYICITKSLLCYAASSPSPIVVYIIRQLHRHRYLPLNWMLLISIMYVLYSDNDDSTPRSNSHYSVPWFWQKISGPTMIMLWTHDYRTVLCAPRHDNELCCPISRLWPGHTAIVEYNSYSSFDLLTWTFFPLQWLC